MFHVLESTEY